MQLTVAGAELKLLEEQRVVVEGERVEDVEVGLSSSQHPAVYFKGSGADLLGENEGIVDQHEQALLQTLLLLRKRGLGRIVIEVSGADVAVLRVLDDGGFEGVEREEVGDLLRAGFLHNIRPDDLLLTCPLLVHQPVVNLFPGKFLVQFEPLQVSFQEIVDSVDILGLHRPQTGGRGVAREVVLGDLARLGRAGGERREPDLVQLQPVQGTMVVPARADRLGQDDARGVDGLVDAVEVAAAGDLLDEHGRQALGP